MTVKHLLLDRGYKVQLGADPLTEMQTKEQLGTQFVWELTNIKKDLEAFLEMNRNQQLDFAPTLVSRMQVSSARLKLFRETLG